MADAPWSSFYNEAADTLAEFDVYAVGEGPTTPGARQFSERQISGQFEDDTAKEWEEDWEDEDPEDSLEHIASMIACGTK